MAKTPTHPDVLVLGNHPCAYLAAAILSDAGIHVTHATIPGELIHDRLVTLNPAFFDLHALAAGLKRKLELEPIYGLKFLADDPATSSSHVEKTISAYVGDYKKIRDQIVQLAQASNTKFIEPAQLQIKQLDETGIYIEIDGVTIHAKLLLLAGELPPEQKRMIGLEPAWDSRVLRRCTFVRVKN